MQWQSIEEAKFRTTGELLPSAFRRRSAAAKSRHSVRNSGPAASLASPPSAAGAPRRTNAPGRGCGFGRSRRAGCCHGCPRCCPFPQMARSRCLAAELPRRRERRCRRVFHRSERRAGQAALLAAGVVPPDDGQAAPLSIEPPWRRRGALSNDLAYSPAIPVRFFAWIRRPHSARSLHVQGRSSSALVAAILRASSSSSPILRCASVCHRWEGGVSPRKP
jgi:hypothetical protein